MYRRYLDIVQLKNCDQRDESSGNYILVTRFPRPDQGLGLVPLIGMS